MTQAENIFTTYLRSDVLRDVVPELSNASDLTNFEVFPRHPFKFIAENVSNDENACTVCIILYYISDSMDN